MQPTPFQRDLSATHAARLADVIDKIDRFLDPIIAVRGGEGGYWTPNGHHRLRGAARDRRALDRRARAARARDRLSHPGPQYREGSQRAREVPRGHPHGSRRWPSSTRAPRKEFALEFEDPSFLTLGATYEKKGRFSGGAYAPVLERRRVLLRQQAAGGSRGARRARGRPPRAG